MNKLKIFRSKTVIFVIQIIVLSLFIYLYNYKFEINFDKDISKIRKDIIQFLANYINYNDLLGMTFIYLSWIIVSFIPIFIFNDYKKAYSMNLMTFFFPNFFFYIFLSRYSPDYFNSQFSTLFTNTILLGILIVGLSIGLSILLKIVIKPTGLVKFENLASIRDKNRCICPHCGTKFESIPKYCYNCSKEILFSENTND